MEILTNYIIEKMKAVLNRELASSDRVPRPKALAKLYSERQKELQVQAQLEVSLDLELNRRAQSFSTCNPEVSELDAFDLAARSLLIQAQLENTGAVFGDTSFNFFLSPLKIPRDTYQAICQTAQDGFATLKSCQAKKDPQLSEVETRLAERNTPPNGARVDIIVTKEGPKIIEVNTQWVDAIQALQGMQLTYLGQASQPAPVECLARLLKPNLSSDLAIIDITKGSSSRSKGAASELIKLSQSLRSTGFFGRVEVIDPVKFRPSYLGQFRSFYVNGDPKMIGNYYPKDWLEYVMENPRVFPVWNPGLDSKQVLVEAYSIRPDIFARTQVYSGQGNGFVKGKGFSSDAVAYLQQPEVIPGLVWQEDQLSVPIPPQYVFDTSSNQARLLQNPNTKFNVWIIGKKVVGCMVSASESKIISDKDYNCVPTLI